MRIVTNRCFKYNHPEVELYYDDSVVLKEDLELYISYLEESVKNGTIYKPGQTIQIGCMVDKIVQISNDKLKLVEPDLINIPIKFVDSVTNTFKITRLQKDAVESVHDPDLISFPSILNRCLICNSVNELNEFTLERFEVQPPHITDCGWFVGCLDSNHDHNNPNNCKRTSLYDVFLKLPTSIIFYALPIGSYLELRNGKVLKWLFNDKEVVFKKGSLLSVADIKS